MKSEIISPEFDHEAEAAECLAWLQAESARRDAERATRPPVDYDFKPQQQGFVHTPTGAATVLALIQQAGYPKARLVGSVSRGHDSSKDIDVLIPLRTLKAKQQCIKALRELFNPSHLADCRGLDGFGMVAKPHGVLDFFFNNRYRHPELLPFDFMLRPVPASPTATT